MGDKVPIAEAEVKSESSPAPSPVADASPSTTSTSAAAVLSATTASTVAGPAPLATPPPLANSSFVKKEEEDAPAGDAPPGGTSPGDVDLDDVIKRLLQLRGVTEQSVLTEQELLHICERSRELLLAEPSFLKLDAPLKVCGDIHGQFMDLLRLLDYCGYPPNVKFLFLGDYVDRGPQSLEVITLLLAYKIKHPEHVYLLRGNHECQNICRVYGFYDQCKKQFNFKVWKAFVDVFNCLPFAALVDERIFCVHGGLSPHLNDLEELDRIKRPVDVVDETGMLCDCLWSDPDVNARGWAGNDRGVSHVFGPDIVKAFLEKFDLDLVVRAHQVNPESGVLQVWLPLSMGFTLGHALLHTFLVTCRWWRVGTSSLRTARW